MDFYRLSDTQRWLRSLARSAAKHKRRTGLILVVFAVLLYVLFDNKGIVTRIRLEMKKREMVDQLRRTELETDSLKAQLKALEGDQKTIETIAREKYGMTRRGETLYRIQPDSSGDTTGRE